MVTTLIHYFILAAFCWTICEALVTYIMIASEMYSGLFINTYLLLAIGWGECNG